LTERTENLVSISSAFGQKKKKKKKKKKKRSTNKKIQNMQEFTIHALQKKRKRKKILLKFFE
jgi:hypothetical protein